MKPTDLEREHVHRVYDDISDHFSATRYKPWPVVQAFLHSQPAGSVGVDFGAGNGKNALPFAHLFTVCLDMSAELLKHASSRGAMTMLSSIMSIPLRPDSMDYGVCIAVLHHLSSAERRLHALCQFARVLKQGGRCLVFVWAFERNRNKSVYRHDLTSLDGGGQDVLVPWRRPDGQVDQRYYHLFREGELESLVRQAGLQVVESGYDRDNYYVIFEK